MYLPLKSHCNVLDDSLANKRKKYSFIISYTCRNCVFSLCIIKE